MKSAHPKPTQGILMGRSPIFLCFIIWVLASLISCSSEKAESAIGLKFDLQLRSIRSCAVPDEMEVKAYVQLPSNPTPQLLTPNSDNTAASIELVLTPGTMLQITIFAVANSTEINIATANPIVPDSTELTLTDEHFTLTDANSDGTPDCQQLQQDPITTSCAEDDSSIPSREIAWRITLPDLSNLLMGSPAINNANQIITGGIGGVTLADAYSSLDGSALIWPDFQHTEIAFREVALDANGNVFITTTGFANNIERFRLRVFDPTGVELPQHSAGIGQMRVSPSIDASGNVVFPNSGDEIAVRDSLGNVEVLPANKFGISHSKGAIGNNGVYYLTGKDADGLHAFDLNTKTSLNVCGENAKSESSPAIDSQGNVIFGATSGELFSCSPDMQKNWSSMPGGAFESSAIIDELDNIYIRSRNGYIYSYTSTGLLNWQHNTNVIDESTIGTPLLTENGLLVYTDKTGVHALEKSNGQCTWVTTGSTDRTFQDAKYSPTVTPEGRIIFRSGTEMFAINGNSGGLAQSAAWPKWGRDLLNSGRQ